MLKSYCQVFCQFAALCFTFFLLTPLLVSSLQSDRWAVSMLAGISVMLLLAANIKIERCDSTVRLEKGLIALALVVLVLYVFSEIVKLRYLAGVLLLGALMSRNYPRRPYISLLAVVCFCLIIPVPYSLEQSVGLWLAAHEAQLFVSLAQALGLPLYQFGTQVISGDVAVTINSNCSGTLLFVPALMGCIVAASFPTLSKGRRLAILASALPFAFAVNLLRLLVLMVVNFSAPKEMVTAFHDMLGWFVMPIVWAIPVMMFAPIEHIQLRMPSNFWKQVTVFSIAVLIVSSGFLLGHTTNDSQPVFSKEIPVYIAGWTGEAKDIPQNESDLIAADYLIRRVYHAPNVRRELVFTAVFHDDPKVSAEHSSRACFEALGWQVSTLSPVVSLANITVEHLLVKSHVQVQAVTEVTVKLADNAGALRLQFVENPKISFDERHKTALTFMKKITEEMELEV